MIIVHDIFYAPTSDGTIRNEVENYSPKEVKPYSVEKYTWRSWDSAIRTIETDNSSVLKRIVKVRIPMFQNAMTRLETGE